MGHFQCCPDEFSKHLITELVNIHVLDVHSVCSSKHLCICFKPIHQKYFFLSLGLAYSKVVLQKETKIQWKTNMWLNCLIICSALKKHFQLKSDEAEFRLCRRMMQFISCIILHHHHLTKPFSPPCLAPGCCAVRTSAQLWDMVPVVSNCIRNSIQQPGEMWICLTLEVIHSA